MAFINPIFDRTQADVEYAINKIEQWKGEDNPAVTELKGALNVTDLNRIENNIQELSDLLNQYYYLQQNTQRTWALSDIGTVDAVNELLAKVQSLVDSYYVIYGSPSVPNKLNKYQEVNDVEKILFMIRAAIGDMVGSFKKCVTFKCGQTSFLPLKRS